MHKTIALVLYAAGAFILTGTPNLGSYCIGEKVFWECVGYDVSLNLIVGVAVLAVATVVFMAGGKLEGEA